MFTASCDNCSGIFQWISSPTAKVEKDANFRFMLDYLASFTGNLPTQAEVQAITPRLCDTIHSLVCRMMAKQYVVRSPLLAACWDSFVQNMVFWAHGKATSSLELLYIQLVLLPLICCRCQEVLAKVSSEKKLNNFDCFAKHEARAFVSGYVCHQSSENVLPVLKQIKHLICLGDRSMIQSGVVSCFSHNYIIYSFLFFFAGLN